jgi:hypothetical protein
MTNDKKDIISEFLDKSGSMGRDQSGPYKTCGRSFANGQFV